MFSKLETLGFFLTLFPEQGYHGNMNRSTHEDDFNPLLINLLLHPLAQPIRQLLTRTGRQELNQILIDDKENILQALEAGVEIESVYYAGEEVVSDTLRKNLTAGADYP